MIDMKLSEILGTGTGRFDGFYAEWMPIETAPKDGSRIICWARGWGDPIILAWKTNGRIESAHRGINLHPNDLALASSYFGDPNESDDYEFAEAGGGPTHWLPLPPTP